MDRFDKLFKALPESVENIMITTELNIRYFTDLPTSEGTLVASRNGKRVLFTDFRYIEKARETVKTAEVRESKNIYASLKDLFKEENIKRISVEAGNITLSKMNKFRLAFENMEFDTSDVLTDAIYRIRTVKSEDEIKKIIAAQRIAEQALEIVCSDVIKEGATEKYVALALDYNMRKLGAEGLSFTTIALTGAHTSMPHGIPDDRKIKKHDFVLMDFGAVVDGYHSDMTRTVCVGEPTEKMKEIYSIVLKAQKTAIAAARAGMTGFDLDKVARDIITEAGYGETFGHSLGHGVGLEIHELPFSSPSPARRKMILHENNIETIEPGIYLPGEFGVRIEDFVIIKKDGCINMTKAPKELRIL